MELTRSKDDLCETDEEWTRKQDRGGLWYLKDTTFQLFCAIEYQVRAALTELKRPSPPSKAGIIKSVISDEDVQFYWLIASADFEIDNRETLRDFAEENSGIVPNYEKIFTYWSVDGTIQTKQAERYTASKEFTP